MSDALKIYEEIAKENKISDEHNAGLAQRLGFAREQANQMKAIVNRLLFDLTATQIRKEKAKDDDTAAALEQKCNEYRRDLRQTRDAVEIANDLVRSLEDVLDKEG